MMIRVMPNINKFAFSFKKELQAKYAIYDETIKEYSRVGNDISTDLIKSFVINANPKISRQQNYMPKVSNMLKLMIPHFQAHSNFYLHQSLLSSILVLYKTMNIHRKQIFDLIQQNSQQFEKGSILYWFQIYSSLVDIHHYYESDFNSKLKQFLVAELCHEEFQQKNPPKVDHFEMAIRTLKFMLMDQQLDLQQCQKLLSFIESKILPKMRNISFLDRNLSQNLAFLNELIVFQNLKINSQSFKRILQESKKFQVSQKVQSSKFFIKKQNYHISLNDKESLKSQGSNISQNTRIINHGQSSVFETIFARILKEKGYDFKKNVFIGIFEYDVLVEGKKDKIYRPFENIKEEQFKAISPDEWKMFKSMQDFKKIRINQKFDTPVILNLNGPYHYIDSDVYGKERVTRTDEMKGMFLKNYGFDRYNTVHHGIWQQVHEKGVHLQDYFQNLLSQNSVMKL